MPSRLEPAAVAREIALSLRGVVRPYLGKQEAREEAGLAAGGDRTFGIDRAAEDALAGLAAELGVAYYSEEMGLVRKGRERWVAVVDPVDGTRPAVAGLEAACVSVAVAPAVGEPTMGEVVAAAVAEIKGDHVFLAERGSGCEVLRVPGQEFGSAKRVRPSPSSNREVGKMFWSSGFRGRPALLTCLVLEELVDLSSVDGAFFDLGSASFCMTRLLLGQLDAYVDVGHVVVEEVAGAREEFLRVGHGAVLNNSPYDVAAAWLILREARLPVTDARGRDLTDRPLLGSGQSHQVSTLAASTPELHGALVELVARGVERARRVWREAKGVLGEGR